MVAAEAICVFCLRRIEIVVTTDKCTHLQISMPAEYWKELQDEELHRLGVHMLVTRPNGERYGRQMGMGPWR